MNINTGIVINLGPLEFCGRKAEGYWTVECTSMAMLVYMKTNYLSFIVFIALFEDYLLQIKNLVLKKKKIIHNE